MSARYPPSQYQQPQPARISNEKYRHDSPRDNGYPEHEYASPDRKASVYNHNGHKVTKGIRPEGESGRRGIHPVKFVRIVWNSSCAASRWVNILIPFIPAAIVCHYVLKDAHVLKFSLCFVGMVPAANLLGFSGQEFARKLPRVLGVVLETFLGSIVEIVLFILLLIKESQHAKDTANPYKYQIIIQAAILGSILANLLLCLGVCFFVGGLKAKEQTFHDAVADTGSNLMLVAGFALVIPAAFAYALGAQLEDYDKIIQRMSRGTAIVLLLAFIVYVVFQVFSHKGLYDDILGGDERRDRDRHEELAKPKLTLTESILVIVISLVCVCLIAFYLVEEIPVLVENYGVSETFMGLILVPLVEKAAEHITAVDEAYDDQMNMALSHVLGASIQTALLNTPLVVLVGWGLKIPMTLDFEVFPAIVLILAILVVGGFLRDGKSNYLEGALSVLVYVLIAVAAFFYPNESLHGAS